MNWSVGFCYYMSHIYIYKMIPNRLRIFKSVCKDDQLLVGQEEESVDRFVWDTITSCGILNEFKQLNRIVTRLNPKHFGATLFPTARHGKGYEVAVLFAILSALYDDAKEDTIVIHESLLIRQALIAPSALKDVEYSFLRAFIQVGLYWEQSKVPMQVRVGIANVMVDYVEAITEETVMLSEKKPHPNISDYMAWRKKSSGGRFGPLLAELAHQQYLYFQGRMDPLIIRLGELYNLIIIYQNDYVSFKSGRDKGRLNFVFAIENDLKLSPEAAVEHVLYLHDSTVQEYRNLAGEIGFNAHPQVITYLENLNHVLIGATRYHELSARFLQ